MLHLVGFFFMNCTMVFESTNIKLILLLNLIFMDPCIAVCLSRHNQQDATM